MNPHTPMPAAVSEPLETSNQPTPPDTVDPPSAPRARAGMGWGWWLVLLVLFGVGTYWLWLQWQDSEARVAEMAREAVDEVQVRQQLKEEIDVLRRALKALETRAADNAATNKILREELLGMGERASLLEDSVARLADNRLRGEVMLRLNEAEFLLLMGQERLRLFGDVPHAVDAYLLADAVLAGLDDPVLATTRQTLSQELLDLRAVQKDPRPELRAQLAALSAGVDALPAARDGEIASTHRNDSRLMQLLGQLVTVRRIAERDAVLGPVQRETALAALRLQLELAQAALARPDPPAYQHALQQAALLGQRLFDQDAEDVQAWQTRLAALDDIDLLPELPVLGATLQELRGLRAARSLGAMDRPSSPETAPAAEAEAPESTPAKPATQQDTGAGDEA